MKNKGSWVGYRPDPPLGVSVIRLTRGYVAWIDVADLDLVSNYTWYAHVPTRPGSKHIYACSATGNMEQVRKTRIVRMHRLICTGSEEVDHVSYVMLAFGIVDNRRSNLRPATRKENGRSQRKCEAPKTSIFKGVGFDKFTGRWKASINYDGKSKNLGRFKYEVNAAYTYDMEAVRVFGNFALTNFPVTGSTNWLY